MNTNLVLCTSIDSIIVTLRVKGMIATQADEVFSSKNPNYKPIIHVISCQHSGVSSTVVSDWICS